MEEKHRQEVESMDVRNCRRCGSIFNYVSGVPVCPACREEEERKFQIVKKYIQDNVQAEIPEIIANCDVSHNQIMNWIRHERLVFADSSPIGIDCEGCGTMIKTGTLCDRCKHEFSYRLNNSGKTKASQFPAQQKNRTDNPKMRYLER